MTYHVIVEVLTETCNRCGETQWSKPVFDCSYHRFVVDWRRIADAEGRSEMDALADIEKRVAKWLMQHQSAV